MNLHNRGASVQGWGSVLVCGNAYCGCGPACWLLGWFDAGCHKVRAGYGSMVIECLGSRSFLCLGSSSFFLLLSFFFRIPSSFVWSSLLLHCSCLLACKGSSQLHMRMCLQFDSAASLVWVSARLPSAPPTLIRRCTPCNTVECT